MQRDGICDIAFHIGKLQRPLSIGARCEGFHTKPIDIKDQRVLGEIKIKHIVVAKTLLKNELVGAGIPLENVIAKPTIQRILPRATINRVPASVSFRRVSKIWPTWEMYGQSELMK